MNKAHDPTPVPPRKFEWTTLPRPEYTFPDNPTQAKKLRPGFFTRLCATTLDIAAGVMFGAILAKITPVNNLHSTQMGVIFYYVGLELFFGQSLGKILFRLEMVSIKGPLGVHQIFFRNILRALAVIFAPLFPLVFLLMCSWRRVTLLDLMTGLRVLQLNIKSKKIPVVSKFDESLLVR